MTDLQDRYRGAMVGMAIGDALGAQVEFKPRGSFPPQRDLTGGGPHRLEPGQWTDDTAMALALAEHLCADECSADLMDRWLSWYGQGEYSCTGRCFDIGNRTRAALDLWHDRMEILSPDSEPFAGGNGAVMRVAPVALRYAGTRRLGEIARWQSTLTHGREAARCAVLVAHTIADLLEVEDRTHHSVVVSRPGVVGRELEMSLFWQRPTDGVPSGGRAMDTTIAAHWCMLHAQTAEEAICMAADLGDDADTTAAVTGAMAGARWGLSSLPSRWTDTVAWRERLIETADALLAAREKETT